MKKTVCLNCEISYTVSKMGHFDLLTIGDAGLRVPDGVKRIDLAVKLGVPSFKDVLETVLSELKVQKVIIASEMENSSPELFEYMKDKAKEEGAELLMISHEELKNLSSSSKAVIRTGECTSYANVILESDVTF